MLLGKGQQPFRVKPSWGVWLRILEASSDLESVRVPGTAAEFQQTILKLSTWSKRFPKGFSLGDRAANDDNLETGYVRKHVLRKFLLALSKRAPKPVSSAMLWKDALGAVPDRGGHTAGIDGATTWGKLEDEYGVHPLMISCWACLLHAVPKKSIDAYFRRPGPKLLKEAIKLEACSGYAPSPAMLAGQMEATA